MVVDDVACAVEQEEWRYLDLQRVRFPKVGQVNCSSLPLQQKAEPRAEKAVCTLMYVRLPHKDRRADQAAHLRDLT